MKNIFFKSLLISNFKGIKALEVQFGSITNICGDNATGKSTIFDAITWCLFGKNSQDAKDFSIKNTVDKSLNRGEHTVELNMEIDGVKTVARRTFKEKWTKRRGSEDADFTGHETLFFWNDAPCSAGEYQKKVAEIMPEDLFKQLTNPLYFNMIKWTDRRDILIRMSDVTNERVINGTKPFQELFATLGQKTLEEYKRELTYEKSGLKKQLLDIPARIDELLKSNPESEDWKAIEAGINIGYDAIKAIEKEMDDITSTYENEAKAAKTKQNEAMEALRQMAEIENRLMKQAYANVETANADTIKAQSSLRSIRYNINDWLATENKLKADRDKAGEEIKIWREKFTQENARTFSFDHDSCVCPTCKRALDESTIEAKETEMFENFRQDQAKNLREIRAKGISIADELTNLEQKLVEASEIIATLKKSEAELLWCEKANLVAPNLVDPSTEPEYMRLKAISEQVIEVKQADFTAQKEAKASIQAEIDAFRKRLFNRELIERNNARIDELKADEKKYSQKLADLEKQEFTIDNFNKVKMGMIEQSINNRFDFVRFKLFDVQINGGETPCCETMVNNVPYSDLNHAMQINAGLDCINALSGHFEVIAPKVIDNAESTNKFIQTNGQLIKLTVTKDPVLTISHI